MKTLFSYRSCCWRVPLSEWYKLVRSATLATSKKPEACPRPSYLKEFVHQSKWEPGGSGHRCWDYLRSLPVSVTQPLPVSAFPLFFVSLSCGSGWPQTPCVAEAALKLLILLPRPHSARHAGVFLCSWLCLWHELYHCGQSHLQPYLSQIQILEWQCVALSTVPLYILILKDYHFPEGWKNGQCHQAFAGCPSQPTCASESQESHGSLQNRLMGLQDPYCITCHPPSFLPQKVNTLLSLIFKYSTLKNFFFLFSLKWFTTWLSSSVACHCFPSWNHILTSWLQNSEESRHVPVSSRAWENSLSFE